MLRPNTPVHTSEGLRSIEAIKPGDLVLSRPENDATARPRYRRVLQTIVTHPTKLYHVTYRTIAGSETLTCTGEHPFYVASAGRFAPASQLSIGCEFLLADGSKAQLVSLTSEDAPEGQPFTTFNCEVEEDHTYHVGGLGVWVHNTGAICEQVLKKLLKNGDVLGLPADELMARLEKALLEELQDVGALTENEIAKHLDDLVAEANRLRKSRSLPEIDTPSSPAALKSQLDELRRLSNGNGVWKSVDTPWGRTVLRRGDVDWNYVRPDGRGTNAQAAAAGYAPVRPNKNGGYDVLVLHHMLNDPGGTVVEVWSPTHNARHAADRLNGRRLAKGDPRGVPDPLLKWRDSHPDWASDWNTEQSVYWKWTQGAYTPPTGGIRVPPSQIRLER